MTREEIGMLQLYARLPESVRWMLLCGLMLGTNALAAALERTAPGDMVLACAGAVFKGGALMLLVGMLAPKWGRAFGLLLAGMFLASAVLYWASWQDGRLPQEAFLAQALRFAVAAAVLAAGWRFFPRACPAGRKGDAAAQEKNADAEKNA